MKQSKFEYLKSLPLEEFAEWAVDLTAYNVSKVIGCTYLDIINNEDTDRKTAIEQMIKFLTQEVGKNKMKMYAITNKDEMTYFIQSDSVRGAIIKLWEEQIGTQEASVFYNTIKDKFDDTDKPQTLIDYYNEVCKAIDIYYYQIVRIGTVDEWIYVDNTDFVIS